MIGQWIEETLTFDQLRVVRIHISGEIYVRTFRHDKRVVLEERVNRQRVRAGWSVVSPSQSTLHAVQRTVRLGHLHDIHDRSAAGAGHDTTADIANPGISSTVYALEPVSHLPIVSSKRASTRDVRYLADFCRVQG